MKKYVDLDEVLDVLAKDHVKRTDDQEAEILKLWDEIKKIPKANVVELPCEVGQTLYFLYDNRYANKPDLTPKIYETEDWYFDIDKKGISILPRSVRGYKGKYHYHLNKTVFLSREDAEKALTERR